MEKQNTYCVPFALAFIAGVQPNDVAALVSALRQERSAKQGGRCRVAVKGVSHYEYLDDGLLATLGLRAAAQVKRPGMIFKSWCANRVKWGDKGSWLISNRGHALVYRDGIIYDNAQKQGKPYAEHKFATARLERATLLEKMT
jgi:hypothetical protein